MHMALASHVLAHDAADCILIGNGNMERAHRTPALDKREIGPPFLLAVIRNKAASHLVSGILLRSKTVLTVTVNCSRHSAH